MGYRIEYGQTAVKIPTGNRKKKRFPFAMVIAVAIAGALMIPQCRKVLWDLLLPGDSAVTAAATEALVNDLRIGESVGDAVTAFCREIIAGDY